MSLATLTPVGGATTVVFAVSASKVMTWQSWKLSGRSRWATHEVHLQQPKREFLGPGLQALALAVRLDVNRGIDVDTTMAQFRAWLDSGEVLTLVRGGTSIIDCTVGAVEETLVRVSAKGKTQVIELDLALDEYV